MTAASTRVARRASARARRCQPRFARNRGARVHRIREQSRFASDALHLCLTRHDAKAYGSSSRCPRVRRVPPLHIPTIVHWNLPLPLGGSC